MYANCTKHVMAVTRSMSARMASQFTIQDIPTKNEFRIQIDPQNYATVSYHKYGNLYDLIHTQVPESLQGKGYGKLVAKATFDNIVKKNNRMKLTCEFLDKYYQSNKHLYKEYVTTD